MVSFLIGPTSYWSRTVLYILTSIMVLGTPNNGPNLIFSVFHAKKLKKGSKSQKSYQKICIWVSTVVYFDQRLGAAQNFASIFFAFQLFCTKNIEKVFFNQCMECAAPKLLVQIFTRCCCTFWAYLSNKSYCRSLYPSYIKSHKLE